MPDGKPAGVRCVQLDAAFACLLLTHPDRPAVCVSLKPSTDMCGDSREQALHYLQQLEFLTAA
jgi:hypothetical protein